MTLRCILLLFALATSGAWAQPSLESAVPPPPASATPKPMPIPLDVVERMNQPDPPRSNFDLLAMRLGEILHDSPTSGLLQAYIADVDSPIMLYEREGKRTEHLGSLVKILTGAVALDRLGPRYRYRTTVRAFGRLEGGRLEGDLVIRGTGDPSLGSPWAPAEAQPQRILATMTQSIREAGIRAVWGRIIGDAGHFDNVERLSDWPLKIPPGYSPAPISALSFHANALQLVVTAGGRPRRKVHYRLAPPTDYITINGLVRTVPKSETKPVRVETTPKMNLITVHGALEPRREVSLPVSIRRPALFAATMLRDALIADDATIRTDHAVDMADIEPGDRPSSASWPVAIHFSPPLKSILHTMYREDSHFYADMVVKTLGLRRLGSASFGAGASAIRVFLHENNLGDPDMKIVDGSGLSPQNSVSPRMIVDTLKFMAAHIQANAMLESLPTPLEPGPLAQRMGMAAENNPQATGRIHALVGSLEKPQTAAGYVTTAAGGHFAFVFVFDVEKSQEAPVWSLVQRMLMAIASSNIAPPPGAQAR